MPPLDQSSVPAQLGRLAAEFVGSTPEPRLLRSVQVGLQCMAKLHPNTPVAAVLANADDR